MSESKIPASTKTDNKELNDFHKSQAKDGGQSVNNKVSLQPLEQGEGTFTEGQVKAFMAKQAAHYEAAVKSGAVHATDFVRQPHGTAMPGKG